MRELTSVYRCGSCHKILKGRTGMRGGTCPFCDAPGALILVRRLTEQDLYLHETAP